jgi:hypothetical protein
VRKPGKRYANVPDMTPEEHKRRGDVADGVCGEPPGPPSYQGKKARRRYRGTWQPPPPRVGGASLSP